MPRWVGLLGSWALLIFAVGVLGVSAAAEWNNFQDAKKFRRYRLIEEVIEERNAGTLNKLKAEMQKSVATVETLESRVSAAAQQTEDKIDTDQVITVSTTENKVYLRRGDKVLHEAVCSTGKGTTLTINGKRMTFNTPIGKFRIRSKETNPLWVPPDWHYVEEARERGMRVVHLHRGSSVGSLRVVGNNVVNGYGSPLPPGELIFVGDAVVIPPVGTRQRQFDKVLGSYRLNLGDGYALHGTQATDQLGRSVSHGCIRLADADIERLYQLTNVGDEVIIY